MSDVVAESQKDSTIPEDPMSRRGLLQLALGGVGACYAAAIGYPVYRYLATPAVRAEEAGQITEISLAESDLPGNGTATMFKFGSRPAMLVRHEDGSLVCFDAVCSHLGCTVKYEPDNKRIYCPCHGGVYDMHDGHAVSGPPPRGLKVFRVEVTDGNVIVSRT